MIRKQINGGRPHDMVKDEINFVTEFVQKTLGIPAAEAASLLFDIKEEDGSGTLKGTALPALLDKDKARISTFKTAETAAHDKGYKKAQAEALTKFETDLKEKYGVTSDKQGVELIEFVVAEKLKLTGDEKDDDKIKRSKVYQDMVTNLTKLKDDAVATETKKFNDLQSTIQKESTFKSVSEIALEFIKNELQPILPEGKTSDGKSKADIQLNKFIKDLTDEYEIKIEGGKPILSKDGKLLEDAHGRMLDLKEVVKAKAAEVWDFKEGSARSGTGNSNDKTKGGTGGADKGYKGPIPKTDEEYLDLINKAPDDAAKQEITKVWIANQPKS